MEPEVQMEPAMGPPPGRPRSRRTVEQMHEQMQLALRAPRPLYKECDVCRDCNSRTCVRWHERQREWVLAAGKRHAHPEGTPNKGGQRKSAPAGTDSGKGSSRVHSFLLPPSQGQTPEEAEIAEVLAVLDVADAAEAAEAAAAAEVADAAEAVEAAEAAPSAPFPTSLAMAAAKAAEAAGFDTQWAADAADYDALAPEVDSLFRGRTISGFSDFNNAARSHALFSFQHDDDWDLEAMFAGLALELVRRKIDISHRWRKELCLLLKVRPGYAVRPGK